MEYIPRYQYGTDSQGNLTVLETVTIEDIKNTAYNVGKEIDDFAAKVVIKYIIRDQLALDSETLENLIERLDLE